MKQRRLTALLAVLVALLALRWWGPPTRAASTDVSEAVAKPVAGALAVSPAGLPTEAPNAAVDPAEDRATQSDAFAGTRDPEVSEPRNAFAVRTPPPPPVPPPAPAPAAPRVAVAAPPMQVAPEVPPPPPPPSLQVIGSWRDERGASVFVAGPSGVLQGRVGDVLLSEYRVTQITPQQVLLRHLPSNRDIPLAVPAVAGPSLTASK